MTAVDEWRDRELKLELRNRAVRRASRDGWFYGFGISSLVTTAFVVGWPDDNWGWMLPAFISGMLFPTLLSRIFVWMEVMRADR